MYKELQDIELIELIKSRDDLAFTELYDRYWKKLLAIAYNLTKDKSSAKEIVQKVFVDLWERREHLMINNVPGYLATAIKFSFFRTYYRKNEREKQLFARLDVNDSQLGDEIIDAKFLKDYINGIIEQLPQKCRLVFKYSRESGLRIPEIAEKMEISEKTVEAHLTKALKQLKTGLKEWGAIVALLFSLMLKS